MNEFCKFMKGTSDISGVDRLCPSWETVMNTLNTDREKIMKDFYFF